MARASKDERPAAARKRTTRQTSAARVTRRLEGGDAGFLGPIVERASGLEGLRDGAVTFRFADGGSAVIQASGGKVQLLDQQEGLSTESLFEISGDRERIAAIVSGRKGALEQFAAGGLQIRGDIGYFSDMAVQLGLLKEPL